MAYFYDIPVTVSMANLSHNPPFVGVPEKVDVEGYILKPWFCFDRNCMSQPQNGDLVRFILEAGAYNLTDFPLGGYIIYNDGHIKWAFRWITVVPWSIEADGSPRHYLFVTQRWNHIDA